MIIAILIHAIIIVAMYKASIQLQSGQETLYAWDNHSVMHIRRQLCSQLSKVSLACTKCQSIIQFMSMQLSEQVTSQLTSLDCLELHFHEGDRNWQRGPVLAVKIGLARLILVAACFSLQYHEASISLRNLVDVYIRIFTGILITHNHCSRSCYSDQLINCTTKDSLF